MCVIQSSTQASIKGSLDGVVVQTVHSPLPVGGGVVQPVHRPLPVGGGVVQPVYRPLPVGGVVQPVHHLPAGGVVQQSLIVTDEAEKPCLARVQSIHMHYAPKSELDREALLTYEGLYIGQQS